MSYMIELCKDFLEVKDLNKLNCLLDYGEHIYCTKCVFSRENNSDGLYCTDRSIEDNIKIAENYLNKFE